MRHSIFAIVPCVAMIAILPVAISASANASATQAKPDEDRMICKYRQETGTRFRSKVCKTAAQWDEMAEQHRSGAKELVDRPQILICGPQAGC